MHDILLTRVCVYVGIRVLIKYCFQIKYMHRQLRTLNTVYIVC